MLEFAFLTLLTVTTGRAQLCSSSLPCIGIAGSTGFPFQGFGGGYGVPPIGLSCFRDPRSFGRLNNFMVGFGSTTGTPTAGAADVGIGFMNSVGGFGVPVGFTNGCMRRSSSSLDLNASGSQPSEAEGGEAAGRCSQGFTGSRNNYFDLTGGSPFRFIGTRVPQGPTFQQNELLNRFQSGPLAAMSITGFRPELNPYRGWNCRQTSNFLADALFNQMASGATLSKSGTRRVFNNAQQRGEQTQDPSDITCGSRVSSTGDLTSGSSLVSITGFPTIKGCSRSACQTTTYQQPSRYDNNSCRDRVTTT